MQPRNPNNAKGVDVSHWQGNIDWAKVKGAGYSFAIMKATEGKGMVDDTLAANLQGAREAGIATGVYHFCRASDVAEAQAEAAFFISVLDGVGGLMAITIPPILDIETVQATTTGEVTGISHAWLESVEAYYGIPPMFYSYPWFADEYLESSLSKYKIWLADYNKNPPNDHCGCTEWTFLQFTDKGQVPGIAGNVDLNEFQGSVEELLYKMSPDDANKAIGFLSAAYMGVTTQQDREEFHRLANELRKASGQPVQ